MTDPRTRDDLLDAMSQAACPLCVLLERAERKAVDLFLYDQVNDISRRDALRASRGLCFQHTSMLAEGRSALGVAIISRDILRTMTAELEVGSDRKERSGDDSEKASQPFAFFASFAGKGGAKLAGRIEPQAGCPMCAERPRIEAPLFIGLLHNLRDAGFAAAFGASAGLCRVHLAGALRAADTAAARALAERQAAIWRRLEADLDEFIRKHDYRFQGEAIEVERDVWRRALQTTSGWYKADQSKKEGPA
ncbi:MAG TPA: DUF6062 family protein [Roseiflexaceae bacterium]|nr:DUF6062 family protein [Roseiflexaceae bacterium]